ncbi:MAG: hypothetical protein V6Z82_00450 [Flavobacteriales bacterium]
MKDVHRQDFQKKSIDKHSGDLIYSAQHSSPDPASDRISLRPDELGVTRERDTDPKHSVHIRLRWTNNPNKAPPHSI